jgi:hypothetical protein
MEESKESARDRHIEGAEHVHALLTVNSREFTREDDDSRATGRQTRHKCIAASGKRPDTVSALLQTTAASFNLHMETLSDVDYSGDNGGAIRFIFGQLAFNGLIGDGARILYQSRFLQNFTHARGEAGTT